MANTELQNGMLLKHSEYRIERTLGQGGFGITYKAEQISLGRKVAIKEFFMKELCERDEGTSHVTLGSAGSRETVNRFREKFLKEARNIAKLNHPNIVRIIDVFEENGTAYYVMEYAENGSLADKVKREGYLSESVATRYILQVAEALDYVHQQNMNHLDVKPANIMLNEKDESVLIDFGLSKQYDATTGSQTSSTPVGISEGYAPMEQYKQGGVGMFSPETDIYALGATFFKLLTGLTPPSASDVYEDGLPIEKLRAKGISEKAISVISKTMKPRKKDRMKDVRTFIDELKATSTFYQKSEPKKPQDPKPETSGGDTTILKENPKPKPIPKPKHKPAPKPHTNKKWLWAAPVAIVFVGAVLGIRSCGNSKIVDVKSEDSVLEEEFFPPMIGTSTYTPKIRTYTVRDVSFRMIEVEGGTFQMGATSDQEAPDSIERPVHSVMLSSYYIGETEVTQALWKAVMGSNPSYFKGSINPVETVSWNDCQEFISKLNSLTDKTFRLPTEAEWEFAARGGSKSRGYQYSGSNTLDDVAWYDGDEPHPVKTKQPNELGIYDMSGNVYEWCQDWFESYSSDSQTNPTGASSGTYRMYRGGGWGDVAWECRVAARYGYSPGSLDVNLGLRLVLSE